MAHFQLVMTCNNAAFHDSDGDTDDHAALAEVGRILKHLGKNFKNQGFDVSHSGNLLDGNGNTVGQYEYSPG